MWNGKLVQDVRDIRFGFCVYIPQGEPPLNIHYCQSKKTKKSFADQRCLYHHKVVLIIMNGFGVYFQKNVIINYFGKIQGYYRNITGSSTYL